MEDRITSCSRDRWFDVDIGGCSGGWGGWPDLSNSSLHIFVFCVLLSVLRILVSLPSLATDTVSRFTRVGSPPCVLVPALFLWLIRRLIIQTRRQLARTAVINTGCNKEVQDD